MKKLFVASAIILATTVSIALDTGYSILDACKGKESRIQNPESRIQNSG